MEKIKPIDENEEYAVKDFVVAEIVNSICVTEKFKTNRICVMKKDNENEKIFYDIVSGIPFISFEYLFTDYDICRVGARLPLEYYFPEQEKISGEDLYSFNTELLFDGFNAPQKSNHVKQYTYDIRDIF